METMGDAGAMQKFEKRWWGVRRLPRVLPPTAFGRSGVSFVCALWKGGCAIDQGCSFDAQESKVCHAVKIVSDEVVIGVQGGKLTQERKQRSNPLGWKQKTETQEPSQQSLPTRHRWVR